MACPHVQGLALTPPKPHQSVYREDCTQCFDSIDDPEGLDVCLQCFNGGCAGDRQHSALHSVLQTHPLVLNIKRKRKRVDRDEPPAKITKLQITAETDQDRYDTMLTARCLDCNVDLDQSDTKLAPMVDGIIKANTFALNEEVKAWEQEYTSCEHILMLRQEEPRNIAGKDLVGCSMCDLTENLWICLQCGHTGCGRGQFGGVGGHSHALAHSKESGHGVAVKLGSISADGTADVYCYSCDEERLDEGLSTHLANWGINIADRQKTEKSLTEMQIEQNLKYDFSMTTEDGKELKPVFGPDLTGLKNLGNSCYLASIVQCLYDLPSFQKRYNPAEDLPIVDKPAEDLETQLRKLADGLLSGRYSKPDPINTSDSSTEIAFQRGLSPSMFKHLIGRGHVEFSTMKQQDAFELLQHVVKLISRSKHTAEAPDPTAPFRFAMEQRLQCRGCKKVRYSTTEQDNLMVILPMNKEERKDGDEGERRWKSVTFENCLDNLTAVDIIERTCPSCQSNEGYTIQTMFKTFPDVFVVSATRMGVVNLVEVKVDVPVIVSDEPFAMDKYLSKGQQPDEEALPEEAADAAPSFVPNEAALSQLEGMGFPRVRCERGLHATGNSDANAAMEWLFVHMDDADIDMPLDLGGAGVSGATSSTADPEKIEMLGAMGFGEPQAKRALKETNGDVERAVEWLFSHPNEQGLFEDESTGNESSESTSKPSVVGSTELPADYRLQSIVCHKGTSIHAGHYVAFIRKTIDGKPVWVLFNDEKVVEANDVEEMRKFAYVYFFLRV